MSTPPRRRALPSKSIPTKSPRLRQHSGPTAWHWAAVLTIVPAVSFVLTIYATAGAHSMRSMARQYAAPLLHKVSQRVALMPAAPSLPHLFAAPTSTATLPAGSVRMVNPDAPITVQTFREAGVPFTMVIGGEPGSYRPGVREAVGDMVQETKATAGLNGTFFANASLTGTDNLLIGPSLCGNDPSGKLLCSPYDLKPQLAGRPMVLLSHDCTEILPYDKSSARSLANLRSMQPGLTDAFLGGVWLVRDGVAADEDGVSAFHVGDAEDPRRRAFFAIMADGRPALGATTYVASSSQLAAALQQAGVQNAVLLDSGFSTSLVFQSKVLVTGHTAPGIPSRPVPQALLLYGQPTQQSIQLAESLTPSIAHSLMPGGLMQGRRHSLRRSRHFA